MKETVMRTSYFASALAVLLIPLGTAAEAGGKGLGAGGGQPASPPGFNSSQVSGQPGHNGFDSDGTGSPTTPRGWDEGKADWKTDSLTPNSDSAVLPPGFKR
jgi:hypothetical protein